MSSDFNRAVPRWRRVGGLAAENSTQFNMVQCSHQFSRTKNLFLGESFFLFVSPDFRAWFLVNATENIQQIFVRSHGAPHLVLQDLVFFGCSYDVCVDLFQHILATSPKTCPLAPEIRRGNFSQANKTNG